MKLESKILITGGTGLVGTALENKLIEVGYKNLIVHNSKMCDLSDFNKTMSFFEECAPDYVFHLAATVYGIMGNMENKGLSFFKNTLINTHVIEACRITKVKKIVAMGSGCVYPYPSPGLPLSEDMVWMGKPHHSEDSYAHSKRAMLAQLSAYQESYGLEFAFVISGNLYGPNDKFDVQHGHVVPSLIRKFYEARRSSGFVSVWGNGSARRDFIHSADVAEALSIIMEKITGPVNMGSGQIISIKEIVDMIAFHTDMKNRIVWDETKPNGQDYRAYDLSKLFDAGFVAKVSQLDGLKNTYDWYAEYEKSARK